MKGGQLQILGRGAAGASPQRVGAGAAPGFLPIFFSPLLGASSISRIIPRISTGVDRPEGPPRHGVRRGRRARGQEHMVDSEEMDEGTRKSIFKQAGIKP